jgi:hypothetical protein
MWNTVGLLIVLSTCTNIVARVQQGKCVLIWVLSKSTIPWMRSNYSYTAVMCSMAAVWQMYGYQDYPAPELPVCVFEVCSGTQLKDFIQRCKVTDLQIYYNHPAELDALKYTDFLTKYNTLAKLPKYYEDCPNALNNISID